MSRNINETRRNIPEPTKAHDWRRWAMDIVLWWRARELSRRPIKPTFCLSTELPSAGVENGIIIWVEDIGQLAVSYNGQWFPITLGGAL